MASIIFFTSSSVISRLAGIFLTYMIPNLVQVYTDNSFEKIGVKSFGRNDIENRTASLNMNPSWLSISLD